MSKIVMNRIVIRDLDHARELDARAMLTVRGGWFGGILYGVSSQPAQTSTHKPTLYQATCKGSHIPTVTIAI